MKNIYFCLMLIGCCALGSTGCASQNDSLRAQVNALTAQGATQDAEIAHLKEVAKEDAIKAKDAGISTAEDAWNWVKAHSIAAWNSNGSVEARDRFQKCWNDLSNGH